MKREIAMTPRSILLGLQRSLQTHHFVAGHARKREGIPSVPGIQASELVDEKRGSCEASHEENGIVRLYLVFDMPLPAKGLLFPSTAGRDPCHRIRT
ncbi:hypothetical protein TgHK011_004415 [Trichoderma gracile]|nr:hypothetical protein TgHK011_004415 [Trichoderma gracile]